MKINPDTRREIKTIIQDKIEKEKNKMIVTSAQVLSAEQKKLLKTKLGIGERGILEYAVDPSLGAGIIVQTGSKIMDLSLQGKLQNLQHLIYDHT